MGSPTVREIHSIDTWRLFAAFLVVCVHYPLPGMAGGIAITYAKTAVPFFIIVSGYFCYREEQKEFAQRLIKQIIKLSILCVFANLLYFAVSYYLSGVSSLSTYKLLYLEQSVWKIFFIYNESPFAGHLWFLGSMVYAMVIMLILTKLHIQNYAIFLSPVLLGIYIYMARSGNYNFIYCRNAVICTMPYFMYGCLIRRYEDGIMRRISGKAATFAFILVVVLTMIEFLMNQDVSTTYIGPEILDIVLVLFLLKFKNIGRDTIFEWLGRRDTLFIYIMHFIIVAYFYKQYEAYEPIFIEKYGTFIIFFVTLAVSEMFQMMKKTISLLFEGLSSKEKCISKM